MTHDFRLNATVHKDITLEHAIELSRAMVFAKGLAVSLYVKNGAFFDKLGTYLPMQKELHEIAENGDVINEIVVAPELSRNVRESPENATVIDIYKQKGSDSWRLLFDGESDPRGRTFENPGDVKQWLAFMQTYGYYKNAQLSF